MPYPEIWKARMVIDPGDTFELTLDGTEPQNDPYNMVREAGHNEWRLWSFRGKEVEGVQTRRFKIMDVGVAVNTAGILARIGENSLGKIPSGKWIKPFQVKFPQNRGLGPVGILDESWVDEGGHNRFPYLDMYGKLQFSEPFQFLMNLRWLWILEAEA